MVLRTISLVLLSFGIATACVEASHASTPNRADSRKVNQRQERVQKHLVTTMPAPNQVSLDSSLNEKTPSSPHYEREKELDISLPSPSVRVGSKEVLMSPWMPVKSSLGVQMELTW